ncbi:MAG: TPM domain-containing protein [Ignavibacteria bacterium]
MKRYLLLLLLYCLTASFIYTQSTQPGSPVTKLTKYITDETNSLSSSQLASLESKLSNFEKETSNQLVLYIIKTLGDGSLEEMSYEIAEKNKIGQKGKDNGVLLFIVMDDRKLRIEVGYGLEGALPDALCNQIIRKEITPYFKQGKYYEGINAGIEAIINATKGEYKQETESSKDDKEFGVGVCGLPVLVVIIMFFFAAFFIFSFIRGIFGWRRGGKSGWWYTGGSSGSSWSSGSSGYSGGFSGGGGSFGGGGASGSW